MMKAYHDLKQAFGAAGLKPIHKFLVVLITLAICCVLLVGLTVVSEVAGARSVEKSKARGEFIAHALEQFAADHGTYPKELDDLVPDYLSKIPRPTVGTRRWEYSGGEQSFSLLFGWGRDYLYPSYAYIHDDDWLYDH
jgi:type II secretory pathway pseudopilin PulG